MFRTYRRIREVFRRLLADEAHLHLELFLGCHRKSSRRAAGIRTEPQVDT